jgi:hypothetical protein
VPYELSFIKVEREREREGERAAGVTAEKKRQTRRRRWQILKGRKESQLRNAASNERASEVLLEQAETPIYVASFFRVFHSTLSLVQGFYAKIIIIIIISPYFEEEKLEVAYFRQ